MTGHSQVMERSGIPAKYEPQCNQSAVGTTEKNHPKLSSLRDYLQSIKTKPIGYHNNTQHVLMVSSERSNMPLMQR